MERRITRLLSFRDPTILSNYQLYKAKSFLKAKGSLMVWIAIYCAINLIQNILELTLSSESEHLQGVFIANIVITTTASMALLIALHRYKEYCLKWTRIFEGAIFLMSSLSAVLATYQFSSYNSSQERLMMLLASIFIHQTYCLATKTAITRIAFITIHAMFILIFNRDLFVESPNNLTARVLFVFICSLLTAGLLIYSVLKFERVKFLKIYDSAQKDRMFKQIVDSLPQGAAIIEKNDKNEVGLKVKFDNPAFKELFGEADELEKVRLLEDAFKDLYFRELSRDKLADQFSGYLDTPMERSDSRKEEVAEKSEIPSSEMSARRRRDRHLASFRSLVSIVHRNSVTTNTTFTPRISNFLTFDSKVRNKTIEIKAAKSNFEGKEVIIATFTDVTQRENIAKLNDKNEFKDNLLSSFSHELKTPLNASQLLIESALLSESLEPDVRKNLQGALISNKRLGMILSDILDLGLIESNNFAINLTTFDLNDVFADLKALYESQAIEKGMQFVCKTSSTLTNTLIRSDQKRLLQILFNLCNNSFKFTPGGGSVYIGVKEDPAKAGFLRFKVRDTGIGMSEEEQMKLRHHLREGKFANKVTESSSGAGVGLFVCHQIATSMGKGITFYAEKGKGSIFYFSVKNFLSKLHKTPETLNMVHERSQAVETNQNQPKEKPSSDTVISTLGDREIFLDTPASPRIYDFGNKLDQFSVLLSNRAATTARHLITNYNEIPVLTHVLGCKHPDVVIADDDPFNIMSLKAIIKKLNHDTFVGYNGKEIIDYIESFSEKERDCRDCKANKIFILDINMPVMDGYTCVKLLRQLMAEGKTPKVPVIACTAYVHQNEKTIIEQYGFDDVLPKPVNVKKLQEIFEKYLKE